MQGPTHDQLELIVDVHCDSFQHSLPYTSSGVTISERVAINAANHVFTGSIGQIDFAIEAGDMVGTEVHGWGEDEFFDLERFIPPPPVLLPIDPNLCVERPEMFKVFLLWRKEAWFRDMEGGYSYDRHFAPGCATENYWRSRVEQRGLRLGDRCDLDSMISRHEALGGDS